MPALLGHPAALAEVPLFLLALLVVRGLPALLYTRLIGRRLIPVAGLMQATTLTFVIVASQVGLATGHISAATSASLLTAALLSAAVFPAAAMRLLAHDRQQASEPPSPDRQALAGPPAAGPGPRRLPARRGIGGTPSAWAALTRLASRRGRDRRAPQDEDQ